MIFGDRVRVGFICGHDIFYAINTTIMRLLSYPLPAITITEKECTHIMTPILASVLGNIKTIQTIKCDVIYGPIHLQGMGFKNIYTLLGAIHLTLMTQFYGPDTGLGRLLQTSLECTSMELGLHQLPFHYDYKNTLQ